MSDPYASVADFEQDPYAGVADLESARSPPPPAATRYSAVDQGNTLQVFNPFGRNFDTGIPIGANTQNFLAGVGKLYSDALLGARQLYAQTADAIAPQSPTLSGLITGQQPSRLAALQQEAADKRSTDTALMNTKAGRAGEIGAGIVTSLPLLAIPGAATLPGAAAIGGGTGALTGALTPTTQGESRALNTAVGGVLGAGTQAAALGAGNVISRWLTQRAAQPFMGYSPAVGDKILAQAVGSDASWLDQPAISSALTRLRGVFNDARSPNVTANLGQSSLNAVNAIESGLNPSARAVFEANPNVTDFLSYLTSPQGTVSAQKLGSISTGLRQDASAALNSEGGNREAGLALKALKEHVDDVVGSTITNPQLAAAYTAARPQYSVLMDAIDNPTLLKASTGRTNLTAFGNYLQRNDPMGFSTGANQSPLYQAAAWGQRTGEGKGPPPVLKHLGLDWLGYRILNNPVSSAIGGSVSRAAAPIAPYVPTGLQGIAFGVSPQVSEALSQQVDQYFSR